MGGESHSGMKTSQLKPRWFDPKADRGCCKTGTVIFSLKEFAMNDVDAQVDPLYKAVESLFEKIFELGEEMGIPRKDIFPPTPYEDWGKSFEFIDD